ncbi:MAG: PKD domain-containing protein [Ferruginibacter sp.]
MRLLLLTFVLFISLEALAQPCSSPGMTPQTSVAVCGTLVFPQANVPSCSGPDLPAFGGCSDPATTSNSVWYSFHCYQSGTLGFLITPLGAGDDYDWAVMDITGRQPQDVLTTNLTISLNLSGVTGPTGCTSTGTLDVHCAGGAAGTQFNRMPPITAGHDYLVMVTNWSNSGLGYNLSFSGGTAVLTDNQLPNVSNAGPVGCNTQQVRVQFTEEILCSSITAAGSEFTVTDGTNTYPFTSITSQCSTGQNATTSLILNMQNPLPPGNYQLQVNTGTDANTVLDVCVTEMLAASFPFSIAAQPPVAINNITYTGCAPTVLKVALSKPVLCNSITATGSEFSITPGGPAIASVQTACGGTTTYTDTIQVVLQNPLPHGSYNLVVNSGTDGNTLVDTCSNALAAGYQFPFTIAQTTTAPVIQSIQFNECQPDKVVLNFNGSIACNSLSANGSEFSITPGTFTVTDVSSNCIANGTTTQVTLTLSGNLPAGNFNVNINNGSDGNTLSDSCFAFITAGTNSAFVTTQAPAPVISNFSYTGCAPTVLKIALSKPIQCNSITTAGTEFSITPGNPAIASVQTACGGATTYTDTIQIVLQNPLPHGSYQLIVNNGSDANTLIDTCNQPVPLGYQYPFTIVQTTTAPVIQSVSFDECKPFRVVLNFDKSVACNSLSATGSEFSITPGTLTVTGISTSCTNGTTLQAVLTLSGNLPAGNFNVNVNNGTDGNTFSDSCFAFIQAASVFPFTTTQAPAPVYDSVQYDRCSPQTIKIFYNHPILCSSVNSNGTEFSITGPSPVTISSVSTEATCSNGGYTHTLTLNLAQPINSFGTYTIHNIAGTDGNSVTDTCYAAQNLNETIAFNVLGRPSADFEDSVHFGCVTDTLVVLHPGGNGISSWEWTFSDGTVLTGQSVTHEFPVSTVTASVQLVVSNGICNDTLSRTYTLNNAFVAGFTVSADTVCRNSNLSVTNTSSGNNLTYQWNYSDGFSFAGQTPPAHAFATPGNYTIRLTATNDHACTDDSIRVINVTDTPVVRFTGLNAQYCTAEEVTLTSNISGGNVSSYTWNNGNGVTQSNQPVIAFTYGTEGNYSIVLTATDRFCGSFSATQSTQVYRVPVFSLGNDITLCPGMTTQIGVDAITGYTYLWNTGATTSRTVSGPVTATYTLTVNNNSCTASDDIIVRVLDNCLIKVPTAFTPNNDGLNDRLKAINADLAREFSLKVYNRYGQLVFATSIPTEGWDGRYKGNPVDTGTYVWVLSYIHPVTGQKVFEKGTSILIR